MPKHGKLKDIKIQEISLVDLPANKLPFLFFKRDGSNQAQTEKAKKKINVSIESDGTVGGTSISVNGDKLKNLKSFDFGFYGDDPKSSIHASYSVVAGTEDGFSRTENYYLSKGENNMDSKILKALQTYLGTEDIDFEKKVDNAEIEKALNLISEHYKADFPEDLENAVGVLVKIAASSCKKENSEGVEKVGAKFSKDVIAKLKAVVEAVDALKSILPDVKEGTKKSGSTSETSELTKQIAELKEAVAKLDTGNKSDDKSGVDELTKTLKDVSDRLAAIESGGAVKKSIDDQDNDDDENVQKGAGEGGKKLWPTITGQGKQE
jgi:hypothetical protein